MSKLGKIRVGIIGTGFGAKVHAPMMNFHDRFEVVALSSVSRGNVEEAKRVSGIDHVYTDWKQMLNEESLDLVVVASAVFLHKEMVLEAFKTGAHVLCEKPMALHKQESADMVSAWGKSGRLGLINHEFRFLPARRKVKEIISEGNLGEILHIRYIGTFASFSSLISKPRGWLGQTEKGGGMLGAIGSHMIDSLQWWTDSTFNEVNANLLTHVPILEDDEHGNVENRTADDGFQVLGRLANGATVTLELLSAARNTKNPYRLEVYGTNGTLVMENDKEVFLSTQDQDFENVELDPDLQIPDNFPEIAARYYNGFNRMLDVLAESISSGERHPYLASFGDGLATQTVLDAIRESARNGKKVVLSKV